MLIDGPTFVFRFWLAYIRELAAGGQHSGRGGLIVGVLRNSFGSTDLTFLHVWVNLFIYA